MEALYRKVYIGIKRCVIYKSENHNLRCNHESHFFSDRLKYNENIVLEPLEMALRRIRLTYLAVKGVEYPKDFHPLKEMVFVIGENTTMEQILEFCRETEKELKINAIQIHIHRDEGRMDHITSKWKCNYHAHIVWDTVIRDMTSEDFGKAVPMRKYLDFFYVLASRITGMERGVLEKKTNCNIWRYKLKTVEMRYNEVSCDLSRMEKQRQELEQRILQQNDEIQRNQSKIQVYEKFFRQFHQDNIAETIEKIVLRAADEYSLQDVNHLKKPFSLVFEYLAKEASRTMENNKAKSRPGLVDPYGLYQKLQSSRWM